MPFCKISMSQKCLVLGINWSKTQWQPFWFCVISWSLWLDSVTSSRKPALLPSHDWSEGICKHKNDFFANQSRHKFIIRTKLIWNNKPYFTSTTRNLSTFLHRTTKSWRINCFFYNLQANIFLTSKVKPWGISLLQKLQDELHILVKWFRSNLDSPDESLTCQRWEEYLAK